MAHEDETDPLVPDPPFEIFLEGAKIPIIVIPGWDEEKQESEFEIFIGSHSIGVIRRRAYDVEGWDIMKGTFSQGEANEIGYHIDDHYFD